MSSKKFYGYYIKCKKLALIEKDVSTSGSDLNAEDYGKYKSPKTSVTDGLELEYTYAPTYNNFAQPSINVNIFFINGWTVIGGYLTFLISEQALNVTYWTSSPYSAVTSGSAGGTNDYIEVRGSGRWNGIHKIQTAGTEGQLITYTRVNETLPYFEDRDIDFNANEEIYDGGSSQVRLANHFNEGDYIWISGVDGTFATVNNGLFRIASITQASAYTDSKITVDNRYMTPKPLTSTSGLVNEVTGAAGFGASSGDSTVNIYKAYRDYCHILTDITVLEDESFELDLPAYLNKAIVYYLKAKEFEFKNDIKGFQHFMSEFKKQMEKFNSRRR